MKKLLQPFEKLFYAWVLIFMTAWSGNVFAQTGSINLAAQVGTLTYGTTGSVTYNVSFSSPDQANTFAGLAVTGLPAGATAAFSPTSVTGVTGTYGNITLTITTTGATTPAAVSTITVTGTVSNATPSTATATPSGNRSLTVAPKALSITATVQPRVYGTPLSGGLTTSNFTTSGLVNGNTITGVTLTPDSNATTNTTNAGLAYAITPSGEVGGGGYVASNYAITYVPYTGLIAKANLTVTATNPAKVYGTSIPLATVGAGFTSIGLMAGDLLSSATLTADAAANTASTPAGASYMVTPSDVTGSRTVAPLVFIPGNYNITYVPFTGTVGKYAITVVAPTTLKAYGQVLAVTTKAIAPVNGVLGEIATSVTITPDAAGLSATTAAGVAYTVASSAATGTGGFLNSNYNVTYAPVYTGSVSQAVLTITATPQLKAYGTALVATTGSTNYSVTGLVNGEGFTQVTVTPDAAGTTANTAVGATYVITPSALANGTGGFNITNYAPAYVAYTGTVTAKTLTIVANAASFDKFYGQVLANGTFASGSFTVSGIVSGSGDAVTNVNAAFEAPAMIANTPTGTSFVITSSNATGTGLSNYNIVYNTVSATTKKATGTVTVTATGPAKSYGTAIATGPSGVANFTVTGGALVLGETITSATLTPNAAGALASTAAGAGYIVTPSAATGAGGFSADNYTVSYMPYSGAVTPAALTITPSDRTKCAGTVLLLGTSAFTTGNLQLKNGETVTYVDLTSVSAANSAQAFGTYTDITSANAAGGNGFLASNYNINYTTLGTLTVTAAPTVSTITTAAPTCINTTLVPITRTTTGITGIGTVAGLPAGVSAVFSLNTLTISGTPTVSGAFTYVIQLLGGCSALNATGTINVTPNMTVSAGSAQAAVCKFSPISITHTTTLVASISSDGVTGANSLPAGVSATYSGNVITISGSPTVSGTFAYSITLGGGCGVVKATGTIVVTADNIPTPASYNNASCNNTPISFTVATSGATGIGAPTGLPAGVTAAWAANVITISGTPTVAGSYTVTIPLIGGCGVVNSTGTINVTAITVTPASSSPAVCVGSAMTTVTHTTTGATGIGTKLNLPAGVTATWAANEITISGTPTVAGVYNYSIAIGCGAVTATGTITVNVNTVAAASSSPLVCINTAIPTVTHATTGATGVGVATGLPAGVTASWSANNVIIIGTPTVSGTFAYSIPVTGGCGSLNATGTITVTPNVTVGAASSSPTSCSGSAITPITHTATAAVTIQATSGLPSGVTATVTGSVLTISGTPTLSTGTFNYTVQLVGTCGAVVNATGTINLVSSNVPTVTVSGGGSTLTSSASAGNEWYTSAGVAVAGATNAIFMPSVVGSYFVRVTTGTCVLDSANATTTLGVNGLDSKSFSFYPNPVNNELNLSYSKEISSVKVVNLLGQVMLSKSVNATTAKVDMSRLSSGLYLVEVKSGDESKTIKVMKN